MGLIDAGRLRHKITVQKPVTTLDTYGQESSGWENVATPKADIRPVSAREKLRAGAVESTLSHTVMVRYQSALSDVMTMDGWRILYGSRVLNVRGAHVPDEAKEAVIFDCEETTNG